MFCVVFDICCFVYVAVGGVTVRWGVMCNVDARSVVAVFATAVAAF